MHFRQETWYKKAYIHNIYRFKSKWIKDLDVSAKTIKVLEENIGITLCDLGLSNGFLDVTPKAQATKKNIR